MTGADSRTAEDQLKVLQNGKAVYAVLVEWASSGVRLAYSTGPYGLAVEGTIKQLRKPADTQWGVFEASFLFSSTTPGIRAHILVEPEITLKTTVGEAPWLEFGPAGFYSLSVIENRNPDPKTLDSVIAQLRSWATHKMEIWAILNLGCSAVGALCRIEVINDQSFALFIGDSEQQFIFATPTLSSRVSIQGVFIGDRQPTTCIRLASEDGRSELSIYDATTDREGLLPRMLSRMVT